AGHAGSLAGPRLLGRGPRLSTDLPHWAPRVIGRLGRRMRTTLFAFVVLLFIASGFWLAAER
ncbi:hypothetical protein, partial [Mesorhizobium sp. B3-2-1]|uniref:hypothetical protein n=1 Tax=Mesorhizobium sp. B3-2-1 TaxID=2589891 RepID=UPI001AEEEE22